MVFGSIRSKWLPLTAPMCAVILLAGCADEFLYSGQVMRQDVKVALTPEVVEALAGQAMEFGDGAAISPKLKGQPVTLTFGGPADAPKGTMVLSTGGKQIGVMQLTAAASKNSASCTVHIEWLGGWVGAPDSIEFDNCSISVVTNGKNAGTHRVAYTFGSGKSKVTITIVFKSDFQAEIFIGNTLVGTGTWQTPTGS